MTQAKGWVTRKREQFELFAKSEHQEQRTQEKEVQEAPGVQEKVIQMSRGIQEPSRSHKPTQAADTQKAEVTIYI